MPSARRKKPAAKPAKSRSVVPIQSSIESIKGFPDKLIIFKVPASKFWWVRYHDGKPIKRSTGTENKAEAIRFAKKFYESVLVNNALGHSNNSRASSFVLCADGLIKEDELRAKRDELSPSYVRNQKSLINKHIKAFFRKHEIGDIDYAALDEFKTSLYEKDLAVATIKMHFTLLSKIFNYAERNGTIKSSPATPKIKNEDNPRGYFTKWEYCALIRTARRLQGTRSEVKQRSERNGVVTIKKLRNIFVGKEIQLLIPFMIYTFIRPTDLKNIKHKHINIKSGDEGDYLWMPLPSSKKHTSPITSMPKAAYYYKQLRQLAMAALTEEDKRAGKTIDDQYVFMPQHENRAYAYQQIYRQFELLLQESKLKHSADGDVRTLYSLRHSSLMYRFMYGGVINTTMLAINARTSTAMLERFYLSKLESSDNTSALHARKEPRHKKKASAIMTTAPITILHDGTPNINDLLVAEDPNKPSPRLTLVAKTK
jgi:hypothetical protein